MYCVRYEVFCKYYTVYTFSYRYSLASRAFSKAKNSVACAKFPMNFSDKYLNFKEIEYFIHYVKFEMRPALYYINFLYFQC